MSSHTCLYFVAVIPPTSIYEEVWAMKKEVGERFHSHAALKSPPHITLHMPFSFREDREERITQACSTITSPPFAVSLKDFQCFAPRVVYVDVVENESLYLLHKAVEQTLKPLAQRDSTRRNHGFVPHMTIAFRDLKKSVFPEVWNHYSQQHYRRNWECTSFSILKHNGSTWDLWKTISYV